MPAVLHCTGAVAVHQLLYRHVHLHLCSDRLLLSVCVLSSLETAADADIGNGRLFFAGRALAAIVLIPTYYALQLTYSVNNAFPTAVQFYENWRTLAANLISFHEPTSKDGLPNLACGVLPLVLIGPFLRSGRIRIRGKDHGSSGAGVLGDQL